MKRVLINTLKLGIPLAVGVWLIYKQYYDLLPAQRTELFEAFLSADPGLLLMAFVVGWTAHVSRGWRWRYLLHPLGYRPGFWACYHAVMIGYFVNMFIPRAGELSRAATLYRTEKVPVEQGFGTIMAERVVDVVVMLLIALAALALQLDKIELFKDKIQRFKAQQQITTGNSGIIILSAILAVFLIGVAVLIARPALRAKVADVLRGFIEGLRTVFSTQSKGSFILHTLLIWGAYLAMFQIGFYSLPSMATVPFAGVLAGFIAGAVSVILVQGGIGVYPAFVALIIGVYMAAPEGGGLLRPDALALGWLLWAAQTLMLIVLGGLSLLLTSFKRSTP